MAMALLVFAVLGFGLGRWLGMGRAGYVALAASAIGSVVVQISLLLATDDHSWMTMLPMVIGATVVAGMLLGALLRRTPQSSANA
jgi:anaerobic C4-dicarboxylate transporter